MTFKIKPVIEGFVGAAAFGLLGWAMMHDVREIEPIRWGELRGEEKVGELTTCYYANDYGDRFYMVVKGDCPNPVEIVRAGSGWQ